MNALFVCFAGIKAPGESNLARPHIPLLDGYDAPVARPFQKEHAVDETALHRLRSRSDPYLPVGRRLKCAPFDPARNADDEVRRDGRVEAEPPGQCARGSVRFHPGKGHAFCARICMHAEEVPNLAVLFRFGSVALEVRSERLGESLRPRCSTNVRVAWINGHWVHRFGFVPSA